MTKLKAFWRTLDKRILWATLAVVSTVLLAGAVEDHRSCLRTLNTRIDFNDYVDAAAFARMKSAINEADSDPVQAKIDSDAAFAFLKTKSEIPNCDAIPAGV